MRAIQTLTVYNAYQVHVSVHGAEAFKPAVSAAVASAHAITPFI